LITAGFTVLLRKIVFSKIVFSKVRLGFDNKYQKTEESDYIEVLYIGKVKFYSKVGAFYLIGEINLLESV
jgi:hypothetical protein